MSEQVVQFAAKDLKLAEHTVATVAALLADGNTIPFIARYRKERTGGLDEVVLANIRERLDYHEQLASRRETILSTIEKAGKLTDDLKAKILATQDKDELEDLYLPYKPKRRTRAQVAREMGLEPLATRILEQSDDSGTIMEIVGQYAKEAKLTDPMEALKGAKDIMAEVICERPDVRREIRDLTRREGMIECRMVVDRSESSGKYDMFQSHTEPVAEIPSHRMLAIFRGSKEKELSFKITVDDHEVFLLLDQMVIENDKTIWRRELLEVIRDSYDRLLAPQIETEIRAALKEKADAVAIDVFAENLKVLLLQPPLIGKTVLSLDPGFRTGVKVAVVDQTGKLLSHSTVYPVEPKNDVEGTYAEFDKLYKEFKFGAVAVGNGTAGKETFRIVRQFLKERNMADVIPMLVNESGASIYSASEVARDEFPDLDLTVRGAISIGRRLQDPLAELVKIDPKSIGVGQYQHDVDQKALAQKLDDVVEFCVNNVGVDLNTASVPLLARVAGLNQGTAKNIVTYRNENGQFTTRQKLKDVPRFGAKSFEQSAGFLRVVGDEPLDISAVHPERYDLVRKMAADLGVEVGELIGNAALVDKIDKKTYISEEVGEFTVDDILAELKKTNRDPRDDFSPPDFSEDVSDIKDLEEGMELNGVVTNVAKFGAFVDIGVHQDGMVHVSELDHRFIKDPSEAVKVGDKVKVKVIEVDVERKRISLSRKQCLTPPKAPPRQEQRTPSRDSGRRDNRPQRGSGDRRPQRDNRRDGRPDRSQGRTWEQKPKRDEIASGRMADLLKAALGGDKDKK